MKIFELLAPAAALGRPIFWLLLLGPVLLYSGCSIETPMRWALGCSTLEQTESQACTLNAPSSPAPESQTAASDAASRVQPRELNTFSATAKKCAFQPARTAAANTPATTYALELAKQYALVKPLARFYRQSLYEQDENGNRNSIYLDYQNREDVQNWEKCLYLSAPLGNKQLNAAWAAARLPCSLADLPADISQGSDAMKALDRGLCARLARDFLVKEHEERSRLENRQQEVNLKGLEGEAKKQAETELAELRHAADEAAANSNFWLQRLVNTYGKKQAWATAGRVYLNKDASRKEGLQLLIEASYLESADNLREARERARENQGETARQNTQNGTAGTTGNIMPQASDSANFLWQQVAESANRAETSADTDDADKE